MNDLGAQNIPKNPMEQRGMSLERGQGSVSEKEAAKQALEAEITRVWEKVRVAEEELESFSNKIATLNVQIAAGEGERPRIREARIAALAEYAQYHAEAAARLAKFKPVLDQLKAQHQTVFGAPFVH